MTTITLPNGKPLDVRVDRTENGLWLVSHGVILVHGTGDMLEDATREFIEMALDQYEDYRADREHLSPHLLAELDYMERLFGEVTGD